MEFIKTIVDAVVNMGYVVILPITIFIIGLIFKMKPGKALKAGLMISIGLQGINIITEYMVTALDGVIEHYSNMGGDGFPLLDLAYTYEFLLDFAIPWASLAIVLCLVINILLIKFNIINVMNVDVWNFSNFFTVGVIAYAITHSYIISLLLTCAMSVVVLIYAKHIAKDWQEFTGIDGVTCTTYSMSMVYFLGWIVNKVFDAIPYVRDWDINIEKLREKTGVIFDAPVLGCIVGFFIGIISGQGFLPSLTIACQMSAVLVLLPKIAGLLMEGLNPLATTIRKTMMKKYGQDRELIIGMDVATGIGESCGITVAVLIIPIIIFIALVCPAIKSFPALLLGGTIYWSVMASMVCKKNVLRALVTCALFLTVSLIFATYFAPQCLSVINSLGFDQSGSVTCIGLTDRVADIILLLVGKVTGHL